MATAADTPIVTADAALVTAARAGDGAAYGVLFERYNVRIYSYAYGIAGNVEDARDIAQDAFVRVFEALGRVTGELNFSAYLYRTAHNLAIDTVKHRGRFAPPDALDLATEQSLRADPEKVALLQEQQDRAWEAAFTLSDNHRAILALRELHDLSYQEIAEVMDMPRTTVGVLLSRARLKFKEAFRMSSLDIDMDTLNAECRGMLSLLSAYIDDELDDASQTRVVSHLEQCAFCRLALEDMTEASRSYRGILPLLPPASLEDGLWTRLGDLVSPDRAQAAPGRAEGAAGRAEGASQDTGASAPETAGGASRSGKPSGGGPTGRHLVPRVLALAAGAIAVVLLGASMVGGVPHLFPGGDSDRSTETAATVAQALTTAPATAATAPVAPSTAGGVTSSSQGLPSSSLTSSTEGRPPSTTEAAPTTTAPPTSAGGSPGPASTTTTDAQPPTVTPTPPSSTTTTTKPIDTVAPPTPRPVAPAAGAVIKGTKVLLEWTAVKDPSGVIYTVEVQGYSEKVGAYVPVQTTKGVSGTTTAHVMTAIIERWRVRAIDGAGNASPPSAWSKFAKEVTVEAPMKPVQTTTIY